ncbi:MAG: hypothetical protein ACRD2U_11335 [Terriglobales bacterium]
MRYLDYFFASAILATAVVFILATEISHLRGAILDIPFLWIVIAILNFLRLRNSDADVKGLRISCIGANLVGLTLEGVRLKLFGSHLLQGWGPYTLIALLAILAETIFSVVGKHDSKSPI